MSDINQCPNHGYQLTAERYEFNGICPYCEIERLNEENNKLKRVYNQLFDACKLEQQRSAVLEKERDRYREVLVCIADDSEDGNYSCAESILGYCSGIAQEALEVKE